MADVDDIIDYIKSLKKGFDKDLFQSKLDELAHCVDSTGLDYDDFHTLFKVWLNLSIPLTKWTNLGACLVPPERVEEKTVEYSFSWILANYRKPTNFARIGFLLDWLTAALDCKCIDMKALDSGYELFFMLLTFEALTIHAMKLVYTLTKPMDVTRKRVLQIIQYAKNREGAKSYRQLQVLLGLFKSYKPECVPENVPAISIHIAFKKINTSLLARFQRVQERRNKLNTDKQHLIWINPINFERSRNKKIEPLVPNMEFLNVGSKQYADKEPMKNYLDFSDPVTLLQYSLQHTMSRPARLRALLCNEIGLTLLAVASDSDHEFLSHDLHHLLTSCFLDGSPHSYTEKEDFLQKLVALQRTLMQGLPVVSRFLAQYLPHWNEKDYFAQILDLVEWIHVDNAEQIQCVVEPLTRIYHRSHPLEQCAILNSLTNMYANLVDTSTRPRQHFMSLNHAKTDYTEVLIMVARSISHMCSVAAQISPEDTRVLYSGASGAERMALAELHHGVRLGSVPGSLPLALMLLQPSAQLVEKACALMVLYKKIFVNMKVANGVRKDQTYKEQINVLKNYTCDLFGCLYNEEALRGRKNGLIFDKLHPQLVGKLYSLMPDVDSKLSIRNHIAFAPYTFMELEALDSMDIDNKAWIETVIDIQFPNLSDFLKNCAISL